MYPIPNLRCLDYRCKLRERESHVTVRGGNERVSHILGRPETNLRGTRHEKQVLKEPPTAPAY